MKRIAAKVDSQDSLNQMLRFARNMNSYLARPMQELSFAEFRKSFPLSTPAAEIPYFAIGKLQYPTSTATSGRIGLRLTLESVLYVSLYDLKEAPVELDEIYAAAKSYCERNFDLVPRGVPEIVGKSDNLPYGSRRRRK